MEKPRWYALHGSAGAGLLASPSKSGGWERCPWQALAGVQAPRGLLSYPVNFSVFEF